MIIKGQIIKGIGGFYYVDAADTLYECKARGLFRNLGITPLVGDECDIEIIDKDAAEAHIVKIHERRTELIRPAVANADQAVVIFAVKNPDFNRGLLDRYLINLEQQGMDVVILFNKADLDEGYAEEVSSIYSSVGYDTFVISNKTGMGLDAVRGRLKGKVSVLSGPSGAGKSSLINNIIPDAEAEVGDISKKIGRGKNTTRHSEILRIDESSAIIDTPGYSSIELLCDNSEDLRYYIREFEPYEGKCRFTGCVHVAEPDCAVKTAVEDGKISRIRYDSYVEIYTSCKKGK